MKKATLILALGALVLIGFGAGSEAGNSKGRKRVAVQQDTVEHPKTHYYRKRARVYGYAARRGGYSYSAEDVVNTYGLTRGLYGSINSYRDPFVDRQTSSGPFDHGFFFDSGIAPRGGNSPYLH